MCNNTIKNSLTYFSSHPILNSIAHSAGGFGLALLLQQYFFGDAFLATWIAWLLVLLSVIIHVRSCIK